MDIYTIRWKDGKRETFIWYSQFKNRLNELTNQGFKRDRDFTAYQMWF